MTIDKHALVGSLSDDLILNLTARMVAIPTRNPPGEEKPCADFIYETLTGWGIEAQLVDAGPSASAGGRLDSRHR
jgi:succinyl-diaminopimelate desuccinylase